MKSSKLDGYKLEEILHKTIRAIDQSKEQIFEIAEDARSEKENLLRKLEALREETKKVIDEVDQLEARYRRARTNLADVSRNFKLYTESDIQKAYEEANQLQIDLLMAREREANLKILRNELQMRLKNINVTIERAEVVATQIGVVSDYLTGDIIKMSEAVESAQYKQMFGLKIIQAQEEERKRVAREIHDGPAQSMANVVLRTEIAERFMNVKQMDQAIQELKDLKFMVRQSLADVRKIIFDLRPMALDDLGLFPTLRKYIQEMAKRDNLDIDLSLAGRERRLPSGMEVAIFRLVQEALNNVVKHAQATKAVVKVEFQSGQIEVSVKDNGIGFDEEEQEKQKEGHFGLMGMKERVDLLEGDLEIQSIKNKGTTIKIRVPVNESGEISDGSENEN
ncbi:sensor histidine kinase [Tepidibacillus decaturensis]|uniref:Signal transduction histidine-protein kinase/phosphatase DegS n=1 Tax=Tepidibacillus decaturensis TaxID=1413211 RepID=A0A135L6Q1_9BACI|nr:sensor histidine kinase [Tepidibacillus decaturensis]KXG44493.1 histidine kinase [Tepidibacillus decaturensis]